MHNFRIVINCIHLYLKRAWCIYQRPDPGHQGIKKAQRWNAGPWKTNPLLMLPLIYGFFSKSRISHVRRSNSPDIWSYQLIYQAPAWAQNRAKDVVLLIFRYFLGRFVPGLKKTIAFFRSFDIFTIFDLNAIDCGLVPWSFVRAGRVNTPGPFFC